MEKYTSIIRQLEQGLNYLLDLDPQKSFLLQRLDKQTLKLEVSDFNVNLFLSPQQDRLLLSALADDQIDKMPCHCLAGSSAALLAMILDKAPQSHIQQQKVTFDGDLRVLRNYQNFFLAIRVDILFQLMQHNPSMAYIIEQPLLAAKKWLHASKSSFGREFREYLQEEKAILPCAEEVADWCNDIQILKQDLDRVSQKYQRLILPEEGSK